MDSVSFVCCRANFWFDCNALHCDIIVLHLCCLIAVRYKFMLRASAVHISLSVCLIALFGE